MFELLKGSGTAAGSRHRQLVRFGSPGLAAGLCLLLCLFLTLSPTPAQEEQRSRPSAVSRLVNETQAEADQKSAGCITCHVKTDAPTMHTTGTVRLGCADCHGGNVEARVPAGTAPGSAAYEEAKKKAHPQPRIPSLWKGSANPVRPYTGWLQESKEYIQFVNPGDLRVAEQTCGSVGCHPQEVRAVRTSMMTHGAMLWQAALYNNGGFPYKNARFGENYSADGLPQRISTWPPPSQEQTKSKGILPHLDPLPRWEVSEPGNVLRVFERGGGPRPEIGSPNPKEDPGRPDEKLSDRGFGTLLRTDPVFLGLQKTRLLDPLLSLPGTNDHPGDYRNSGCSACHVIYANDRSSIHSGSYAVYGNQARSAEADPTIPRNESGHPIKHEFTRAIPTSQCIVCHIHPGTNMVATYLGYTWWDNEMDGEFMYPKKQRHPTDEDRYRAWVSNPEAASVNGLWSDPGFLEKVGTPEFNRQLQHTQFADFHGHGWVFRAVYKRDRKGRLLDAEDHIVPFGDKDKFQKAVQLRDIHLEKGMHCEDCHFAQDNHGNGNIYGETRNALEIDCVDCHGTIQQQATLHTSGPAAPPGGTDLQLLRTPWGQRRFYWQDGKLYQRSMVEKDRLPWEVVQAVDTITPGNPHYSEKSRLAKTILKDGKSWGGAPQDESQLAHANSKMTCYACHSSWTTSCFGCHLPMAANRKMPMLHNEGLTARNYTTYNFEVLRDDIYMLGIDGTVTKHRIAPTRSTCAVVVSSQNANRGWLYYMQQTISAEGFSGFGFSPYYPHTVRSKETKNCTDCHVSQAGDNNAWMAQILMQGTNLVNFMGRYVYVAIGNKGFEAISVAEHDDPPAVIGSDLQRIAYPESYEEHLKRHRELQESDHHPGNVLDVQLRGEYLYAALGEGGFRVYDVANVDNKDFSEKMVTAPVSPLGQRFYVKTKYAAAIASPSTLAVDPLRTRIPENEEQPIALLYGFLYVADKYEGLVVVGDPNLKSKSPGVLTLLDGNPANNFLKRALAFNPSGILNGARRITIGGNYAYILCDRGLVVVSLENPLAPKVVGAVGAPDLVDPQGLAIQFRYAFVVDRQGLKVLDVTSLEHPRVAPGAFVPLPDARNLYVARTYAYVAGGKQGLVIVDVERPEHPFLDQAFTAEGEINDARDVKAAMTASSAFAYVADGKNGLRVVQLFSPTDTPEFLGFSPRPKPKLIATAHTRGPALAISKGIDRDRAVDESGNQLTVFNRRGSRPFNRQEGERLYLRNGQLYTVTNDPPGSPVQLTKGAPEKPMKEARSDAPGRATR
ncbi:MAG: hypothetical protein HY236_06340 [Acidobacteria bacterium]|nr:hypothetical protein [Acidobacteriota bacterium]